MANEAAHANIIYADGTGSFLVLLEVARQQGLFAKQGIDARLTAARGATVPCLSEEAPLGVIGAPAALLQAANGNDVRIIATLSTTDLSGHLVARPGILKGADLRGKRLGVRVVGAGIWISTILALQQLGLDPQRDDIALVPVGSPAQILHALELGDVDAALVTTAQSRNLERKGFCVVLRNYPSGISSFDGVLVARTDLGSANPRIVGGITAALVEAAAFSLAEHNMPAVMQAFNTALNINDINTAKDNLQELWRKPYPLIRTLRSMQKIIAMQEPRVLDVPLETLIDQHFIRQLDESGKIDELFASNGSSETIGRR